MGASLVVQWLRFHAAGRGPGSIPGQGTRSHMPQIRVCMHNEDPAQPSNEHAWSSLVAQRARRLPGVLETQVRSLGREDCLGKEMATHSSILAWKTP